MDNGQFDRLEKMLKRIAFALESIAAGVMYPHAGSSIDTRDGNRDHYGSAAHPDGFPTCKSCGCQLITKVWCDDNICPACGEAMYPAEQVEQWRKLDEAEAAEKQ